MKSSASSKFTYFIAHILLPSNAWNTCKCKRTHIETSFALKLTFTDCDVILLISLLLFSVLQRGIKIQGFDQIQKFFRRKTRQSMKICLGEKKKNLGVRCTLTPFESVLMIYYVVFFFFFAMNPLYSLPVLICHLCLFPDNLNLDFP